MEDPLPENIEGSKRVTHSVNHHINWGYVAVGVGLLVVGAAAVSLLGGSSSEEEAVEVEFDEPNNPFAATQQ